MTQAIHKFQLPEGKAHKISMPVGSKVLDFQYQNGTICMWAIVQEGAFPVTKRMTRRFRIVGTGEAYDFQGRKYQQTLQDGDEVWHIFEVLS